MLPSFLKHLILADLQESVMGEIFHCVHRIAYRICIQEELLSVGLCHRRWMCI